MNQRGKTEPVGLTHQRIRHPGDLRAHAHTAPPRLSAPAA